MKNQIKKYILILLAIIFIIMFGALVYLRFFANRKSNDYATLKEKGEDQIIYLDSLIIDMLNSLNNIEESRYSIIVEEISQDQQSNNSNPTSDNSDTQSSNPEEEQSSSKKSASSSKDNNQMQERNSKLLETNTILNLTSGEIPWNKISFNLETIYTAWPTINIDMKVLNVAEEELSKFSVTLDGVAQSLKNKDKTNTLINLYNLYTMLPRFLAYFINNDAKINLYNAKAYVLSAYVSADKDNWKDMNTNIIQASNSLLRVLNSDSILESEKSSFEKANVLLQELQRSVNIEDKEVFYFKYKLTIEQLKVL